MILLLLSQDVLVVKVVLVLSGCAGCDGGVTVVPESTGCDVSQDLLVEHMVVLQQPHSAFEADRVQHALADLWERAGQGRLDRVED